MDFLFYRDLKLPNVDYSKIKIDLCEDQQVYYGRNYIAAFRPSTTRILKENEAFLISGRIQFRLENCDSSVLSLSCDLKNNKWPLADDYTGLFSGILHFGEDLRIFNDPIGLFHLYYSITSKYIIVATNLNAIYKLTGCGLRRSALAMEMTRPEFSQYGRSTVLEDVYTLMRGEMLVVNGKKVVRYYDITIKTEDKPGDKHLAYDLVNLINKEFCDFYYDQDTLMVSLSGGIDSRINLAGVLATDIRPTLLNFGRPEYIDSKIPRRIARDFGLNIDIIDPVSYQFPSSSMVEKIVRETDSLFINHWLALFDFYDSEKPSYSHLLLGDMCDILRAQGISSIKTRAFRRNHYIKRFFAGSHIKLQSLSEESKRRFIEKSKNQIISNARESINIFWKTKNKDLLEEILVDIDELFEHIDRYNPEYLESYEELFGIFTRGRKSMGKQLNVLKVKFIPETPILNLRIIRKVLNYSPLARYGDELTNQMFRHPAWQNLGSYPTAQNPFMSYNSNIWIMLFGWYLRSAIDQMMLKMYVRTSGGWSRQRIVKSRDIISEYNYPGAFDNFKEGLSGSAINPERLLTVFKNRAKGSSWPLSGQDIVPYLQAAWYLKRFVS